MSFCPPFLLLLQSFFDTPADLLPGLSAWQSPRIPVAEYGVKNFKAFAPPGPAWNVGKTYYVIEAGSKNMIYEMASSHLSPFRYYPPAPETSKEVLVHSLMLQLHKSPFVHLRFGPRGTLAVLRAQNDQYWDIVFRWVLRGGVMSCGWCACVCACVCGCVCMCVCVVQSCVPVCEPALRPHLCLCDVHMTLRALSLTLSVPPRSLSCVLSSCRSHVEFQLNDHPNLPFWFTPAQFAGRLVISKDFSHIAMFEMEVPTNHSLNIGRPC